MSNVNANNNISNGQLGAWVGLIPKEQPTEMPKPHPILTFNPFTNEFWIPVNILTEPSKTWAWWVVDYAIQYATFKMSEQRTIKNLFVQTLENFEKEAGVSPDVLMGYVQWYDGWEYQPFPSLFVDVCRSKHKMPVITWKPDINREGAKFDQAGNLQKETYLDEFNRQIADKKSKLYRYVVKFARKASECGTDVEIRPFHEMNLDTAEAWDGFSNGGGNNAIHYELNKEGFYVRRQGPSAKNSPGGLPPEDGPERLVAAWRNLRKVFKDAKCGNNVKFVWCPEAHPDTEENLSLGEDWNSFKKYWPGREYVDVIGFDVYQKSGYIGNTTEKENFNHIFGNADKFIASVRKEYGEKAPSIAICEASTKPEPYRINFVKDLFAYAKKKELLFVCWFNENKAGQGDKEFDWTNGAKVVDSGEKSAQVQMEQIDIFNDIAPPAVTEKPAAKVDWTKESLDAFTASAAAYTGKKPNALKKDEYDGNAANNDLYYKALKLKAKPQSFAGAIKMKRELKYDKAVSKANNGVGAQAFLYMSGVKGSRARLILARTYKDAWLLKPEKLDQKEKGVNYFNEAVRLLEENIKKENYYTREYIDSLIQLQSLYAWYYENFNDVQGNKNGIDILMDPSPELISIGKCKELLKLLNDEDYLKKLNLTNINRTGTIQRAEVSGLKAAIYVSLGDIYRSMGARNGDKDKGLKLLKEARDYYRKAEQFISEKERESMSSFSRIIPYILDRFGVKSALFNVKERYLDKAVTIGLNVINGSTAKTLEQLNAAVKNVEDIFNSKEDMDPGIRIKAKYYLAELKVQYARLKDEDPRITDELVLQMGLSAIALYKSLSNSEFSTKAEDGIKEAKEKTFKSPSNSQKISPAN